MLHLITILNVFFFDELHKIIPPSEIFVNFYFYYSTFTLSLSLAIAPLQFYIILTKSKNLNSFKWLIINHSFWSLAIEIALTTVKPVFLAPAIAGFPIGLLRNGTPYSTAIATYVNSLIFVTNCWALVATLTNRYLLAFPTNFTKWFQMKYGILGIGGMLGFIYIGLTVLVCIFTNPDISDMQKSAIEYDPCLQNYFSEPAFAFLKFSEMQTPFLFAFGITLTGTFMAFFSGIFFVYLVSTNKSSTVTKLHRSLIISAIVQLSITLGFLGIPATFGMAVFAFQILNMQNVIVFISCLLSTHSIFESTATLYFVSPYRKGVKDLWDKIFAKKKFKFIEISASVSMTTKKVGNVIEIR